MNIFFIGPYRQDNFDGIFSRNIVNSLGEKHNIFARPIYYDGTDILQEIDSKTKLFEDNDINQYDCLIQHVKPIDCLHTNQFKKNVLIPIIDEIYEAEIFIDSTIDKILVDDIDDYTDKLNNNKTEIFDYNLYIDIKKERIFDIGPLNALKKLYFVGEYKSNYDIILGLIRSFIHLRKQINQDYCLVLFAINITQNDIGFIQNYIQQAYKALNAVHTINKVIVIPISMSTEHVIAAHNSGDIFLNFNHCPYNQINKKIAQSLNKKIINKNKNFTNNLYTNNTFHTSAQPYMSDKDITDSIIDYLIDEKVNNTKLKTKKYKHIADIL